MNVRLPALAVAALWLPALLSAQIAEPASLYGKVDGQTYVAPGGFYKIPVPVLPEFGGEIHDTENVVTFDDEVSTHISIANFPLDMSLKWEFETRGPRDFLAFFYANYVLPDFQTRYPGTTTEGVLFLPGVRDGALLVFVQLPGGSFFEAKSSVLEGAAPAPAVAKRGNLLFVRDGRVFVLSSELAERVTQRSVFQKTPAQENEILRHRLIELASRMQFPAKPPPKKP
ncbi:MAG: hypothetical protein HY302_01290 [Opitutae bacterium]|nr:hypothetical protein [Opitutae bacterium]